MFLPVSPKAPSCQYLGLVGSCAILPLQYARPLQSTPPTFATALQLNLELSTNRSSVGSSSSLRHVHTQCYHHERTGMKATGKTCSEKQQTKRVQILLTLATPFQGESFRVVLSINNKRFRGDAQNRKHVRSRNAKKFADKIKHPTEFLASSHQPSTSYLPINSIIR